MSINLRKVPSLYFKITVTKGNAEVPFCAPGMLPLCFTGTRAELVKLTKMLDMNVPTPQSSLWMLEKDANLTDYELLYYEVMEPIRVELQENETFLITNIRTNSSMPFTGEICVFEMEAVLNMPRQIVSRSCVISATVVAEPNCLTPVGKDED